MYNKFIFLNNNKIYYYAFTIYAVLLLLAVYFSQNMGRYEERVTSLLLKKSISIVSSTSTNILKEMIAENSNFIRYNLENNSVRLENEHKLSLLRYNDIQSVYVLYIKKEKLFFLLDTADEDRGEVSEPFMPEEQQYFDYVRRTQKSRVFMQKSLDTLGFTLIKPIIQDEKTVALLVIDYKEDGAFSLAKLLDFIIDILTYLMFIILGILFLFTCYFVYTNYVKYKIYRNPKTNTLTKNYLIHNYDKIQYGNYYVALADIDFFKRVNNIYGLETGDNVITHVIKSINSKLGPNDMFIQYSGEEFLLFMSKKHIDEEMCRHRLEDIRIEIERTRFTLENDTFSVTISIGVLLNTEIEKSLQDVIHKADTALYDAKHNGRNMVSYFDISQSKKLYREKLKEMISSDQLVCYYQPIRNLIDGKLHHYEALLRIEDGDNLIFPDRILPDLEDSYLYSYLTKKVIEFNIEKLRFDTKMKISINLSADDLVNDSILAILAQNADLSERLFIEILENKSIDYKKVELSIQKLKLFGYKICIDDFGSGYSNLNHLLNLSIDFLKIDGSIIKEIPHDPRAHSIVKTFALFCQQNNIEVIAEYIDNKDIIAILTSFGVEYGQGFYFSKALPYEQLDPEHK